MGVRMKSLLWDVDVIMFAVGDDDGSLGRTWTRTQTIEAMLIDGDTPFDALTVF